MTPIGPGGIELMFVLVLWSSTYVVSLSPLSWGFGFSYNDEHTPLTMLQLGPIKIQYQRSLWVGDAK